MAKVSGRVTRLFITSDNVGGLIRLDEADAHYLTNVLRLKKGDVVIAFNGRGDEWLSRIVELRRGKGLLETYESSPQLASSPLAITLVQALVKADAMDLIVQKATELGVEDIRPVTTDHSVVNVISGRQERKLAHWQKIARRACEQCGRHAPPQIHPPASLDRSLDELQGVDLVLVLDPRAEFDAAVLPESISSIAVVVGPEGGFSEAERLWLVERHCRHIKLGARILRAETAAIAICALVQNRWGDLR